MIATKDEVRKALSEHDHSSLSDYFEMDMDCAHTEEEGIQDFIERLDDMKESIDKILKKINP